MSSGPHFGRIADREPRNGGGRGYKARMSKRHHIIDYIEFTVTDMAEAKRFYHEAFGWTFKDYGPEYSGIEGEGREQGGFALSKTPPSSDGALAVLFSDDVEKSFERVKAAGGHITREIYEFPGGRRFELKDPSGNALAVWTTL